MKRYTSVPSGLSNVRAITAGYRFSLAVKTDGTVVGWGSAFSGTVIPPTSLDAVTNVVAGVAHALVIRHGLLKPVIMQQPLNQYPVASNTSTATVSALGLATLTYQWQSNTVPLSGQTTSTLTLSNVQAASEGNYRVIVSNGAGSTTSSNSTLTIVTAPVITGINPLPGRQWVGNGSNLTMSVTACGGSTCGPLGYQWARNGTNLGGATLSSYNITGSAGTDGAYSVIVSNSANSTNGAFWQAVVLVPGRGIAWGNDGNTQTDIPVLTNVTGVAAGDSFSVAVLEDGTLRAWGSYSYGETTVPGILNAVAVAAGANHGLALSGNGTVVAWGDDRYGQTDVPSGLGIASPVKAVAAGGNQSMALLNNGTVVQWGLTNAPVPGGLNDAIAISAGRAHCLALRSNGTIVAWGDNSWGQTNVPAGLTNGTTNVVAIAAGGYFNLALTNGGGVIAWGSNIEGEGIVPAAALTNVMSIAASVLDAAAIRNDGTVVTWGSNIYGEQTLPPGLINIKNISVGGGHYLASIFSPLTQYQVDVTKDLLLIYNVGTTHNSGLTNSTDVKNYYTNNRPLVTGANQLAIDCTNGLGAGWVITPDTFTNQILTPVLQWLTDHPTKHPQYMILFPDIPSRVWTSLSGGSP